MGGKLEMLSSQLRVEFFDEMKKPRDCDISVAVAPAFFLL